MFSCRGLHLDQLFHSRQDSLQMIFLLFAVAIAAAFFVSSMILAVFALIGYCWHSPSRGPCSGLTIRRQLVIQEANAASTAHDRLALFEGDVARDLQTKLKDYVQARIDLYRMPHDFSLWEQTEFFSPKQQEKIIDLKNKVWDAAVAACPQASFRPACAQALPALASLFAACRRQRKHPPQIVCGMLFGLGLGGSLLAGFGMAAARSRSWVHMLIFAATLTVTLYVVTDMEYPRLGLIRIDSFDHFLVDAHQQMQLRDLLGTVAFGR
jgi:hypothetical protein